MSEGAVVESGSFRLEGVPRGPRVAREDLEPTKGGAFAKRRKRRFAKYVGKRKEVVKPCRAR